MLFFHILIKVIGESLLTIFSSCPKEFESDVLNTFQCASWV